MSISWRRATKAHQAAPLAGKPFYTWDDEGNLCRNEVRRDTVADLTLHIKYPVDRPPAAR